MVAFRDVHSPAVVNSAPLHFLPTCIGCSKRWACTAANGQPGMGGFSPAKIVKQVAC
jgi:hypothetical protein